VNRQAVAVGSRARQPAVGYPRLVLFKSGRGRLVQAPTGCDLKGLNAEPAITTNTPAGIARSFTVARMKFFDYIDLFSAAKKQLRKTRSRSYRDFYDRVLASSSSMTPYQRAAIECERTWYDNKRPYYNVWPGIAAKLLMLDVSKVPVRACKLPVDPLVIRFAEGSDFLFDDARPVQSVLFAAESVRFPEQMPFTSLCIVKSTGFETRIPFALDAEETIGANRDNLVTKYMDAPRVDFTHKTLSLCLSLCLLATDASIIEPDVLSADRNKYEETLDEKYVQRARNRGKYGWNVGRLISVTPHYRRGHFALRWTGKGAATPKIIWINSVIVKRKSVTDIPTGYLDIPEKLE